MIPRGRRTLSDVVVARGVGLRDRHGDRERPCVGERDLVVGTLRRPLREGEREGLHVLVFEGGVEEWRRGAGFARDDGIGQGTCRFRLATFGTSERGAPTCLGALAEVVHDETDPVPVARLRGNEGQRGRERRARAGSFEERRPEEEGEALPTTECRERTSPDERGLRVRRIVGCGVETRERACGVSLFEPRLGERPAEGRTPVERAPLQPELRPGAVAARQVELGETDEYLLSGVRTRLRDGERAHERVTDRVVIAPGLRPRPRETHPHVRARRDLRCELLQCQFELRVETRDLARVREEGQAER
ncbi:MAG: hypothetical protein U0169_07490 [Polyangiaceae bacterium]